MRRDDWRKALILAAAGVLLALAAVLLLQRPFRVDRADVVAGSAGPPGVRRASSDNAAPNANFDPRRHGPTRVRLPPTPSRSPERGEARPPANAGTAVSLAASAAKEYRDRAQFPRWSQPLAPGEDPILRDREVSPVSARGPRDDGATLTVLPDQVAFESPDAVLLYAYLTANGERVAARSIGCEIVTESLTPLVALSFGDAGTDGDAVAGDHIYTALYQPEAGQMSALSESFLARVTAFSEEGEEIRAGTSFQYSNPDAQLTGNYRDRLEDGSLVIEAELDVRNPGRFHLEGTLYDAAAANPLAWSQDAAELSPGRQWLRLSFFGRILHERGIDGPYLLRFLALSTATAMPNAKNRLVENAFVTGHYTAAQFSDEPFNDPDLLEAASRLERDLPPTGLDGG
jgi:uncharacterized protein DUF4784